MNSIQALLNGFSNVITPTNLSFTFIGCLLGTTIGVLPGLGPVATMALLLPLTYKISSPITTVVMMAGIYYGAMYGGSTTSILLNIPGEAASVITCIDGHEMAKQGKAGPALGIAAIGSFIAGTISVIGLTFVAPPLAEIALKFGPAEYFSLATLGLVLATYLISGKSVIKGFIMVIFGLFLGTIGLDPVSGSMRFTLDIPALYGGIDFVTLAMGFFGIAEILTNLEKQESVQVIATKIGKIYPTLKEWADSLMAILRGSFVGFFLGILPGGGGVMASLLSYTLEKRLSRHPERFGKGAIEGVAAPESANNAGATSSFIPLLTLGIPGNTSIAMIFAVLLIAGIQPGPFLIVEHPEVFWSVIASMYIGNVMLLALNLPLIGLWVQLLKIPYSLLATIISLLCLIGVYSVQNNIFDVILMVILGIIGYLLRKFDFEAGPLLLAFVLGPICERSLVRALMISEGKISVFLTRPISAIMLSITAILVVFSIIDSIKGSKPRNV